MQRLIVDAQTLAMLRQTTGLTEIRDESGKVIGYYAPSSHPSARAQVDAAAHIDFMELQRRRQSQEKGSPTAEVLDRLRLLEEESQRRQGEGKPAFTDDEAVDFVDQLRRNGSAR